jgi:hypothetical protein
MSEGLRAAGTRPSWVPLLFWSAVTVEWLMVAVLTSVFLMPLWHTPTRKEFLEALCLGVDTTRYAAGYSESAWDNLSKGQPQAAVLASLGPPLERWSHSDDEWWSYSTQRTGTENYRERKVRFDLQGRIIETHEACYID